MKHAVKKITYIIPQAKKNTTHNYAKVLVNLCVQHKVAPPASADHEPHGQQLNNTCCSNGKPTDLSRPLSLKSHESLLHRITEAFV